jgi:hypothetical protein
MSEVIIMAYGSGKSISTDIFNWKRLTQGRWKLVFDESWAAETAENKMGEKHWYQQIPCTCGGHISLYALNPITLKFYTPRQRPTCRKLAAQFKNNPGVSLDDWFDGSESVFYFPVELFEQVAAAVGARKQRQLSEAQKEAMARGRANAGLVRDEKGRIVHSQSHNSTQDEAIPTRASG